MEAFNVMIFFVILKGCVGNFYTNVTETGCISFVGLPNTQGKVTIIKDEVAVFSVLVVGGGDYLQTFANFTDKIVNVSLERMTGMLSFCITNTTKYDGGLFTYKSNSLYFNQKLYVLDKPTKPNMTVKNDGIINLLKGELSCQSFSTSVPEGLNLTYSWTVNDSDIADGGKFKFDGRFHSSLMIDVDRNDSFNVYRCFATEQKGQMSDISDPKKIDPKRKPRITLNPIGDIYRILINQTLTIECVVLDAHPVVDSFTWTKNNKSISEQPRPLYTIVNVTVTDAAIYECIASNGFSTGKADLFLDVLYGPIVSSMTPLSQVDGRKISKTCIVQSNPQVLGSNVVWTKQDNSTFEQTGVQLNINRVNVADHGTFICTASVTLQPTNGPPVNRSGNKAILINVLYGPSITPMTTYSQINGRGINITCIVQSNPPATHDDVIWTKENSLFMQKGLQLYIPFISKADKGTFKCTVNMKFQPTNGSYVLRTDSQPLEINVLYGPEIIPMSTFSQEDGYKIIKECDVDSNPVATDGNVTWTKQGNFSFIQNVKQLNITSVNKLDQGMFICTVSLILTPTEGIPVNMSATGNFEIDVLFGPTITPMITYFPEESENLTVQCIVISNPPATNDDVTWTKQRNPSFRQNGLNLSLVSVDKLDHGTYVCKARITLEPTGQNNVVRTDNETVMINVLYQPIVVISEGNVVYEGNMTTAVCNVTSNPLSNITWTYLPTNTNVPESNSIVYSEQDKSSELKFEPARCDNTGLYSCQANNNIKSTTTKKITIDVKCKPRLVSLENKVENITIGRNESLNHTIQFHAYPEPTCDLQFNKSAVFGFKVDVIQHDLPYESGCRIEKNEVMEADIGPYEIILHNSVGQSVVAFYIIFQREPDPPLFHAVDCIGKPQTVTIQWKPRWNGGLEQIFFVQYKTKGDLKFTNGETFIDDGVKEVYTDIIHKLIPGTDYIFRVSASNGKGSAETHQVNCTVIGKDDHETDTLIVIGATTGSVLGFILIFVLSMFVVFIKRRTKIQKKNKNTQLIKSSSDKLEEDEDDDGLKVNPMYVSSGQIESDKNQGAIYSIVQKANKVKTDEIQIGGNASTVYSQVIKNERKGKGNTSASKKKNKEKPANKKDQSIEMGCVYENSNDIRYEAGDMYANTDTDRRINVKKEYKPTKNKDGLIYADLDLAVGSNDKRFIIRGLENRNNYAVIDLSKTAEPLPSDNDTDDEKDANTIVETHGTGRQQEQT